MIDEFQYIEQSVHKTTPHSTQNGEFAFCGDLQYNKESRTDLYPRFEDYADYTNPSLKTDFSKPIKVNGKMNGNYGHDAGLINNQLGLSETPTGYVWHHIEDGKSMLLVQQKIHSIKFGGFTHKG